jgi:tRNA (cytidine56-2'-O)-methyltransferase
MEIEVLRIGQRVVRDDRVTTHVALVARSFGAQKIYMNEVNPEIKYTISSINKTWGGNFKIEIISEWKKIIKEKKKCCGENCSPTSMATVLSRMILTPAP